AWATVVTWSSSPGLPIPVGARGSPTDEIRTLGDAVSSSSDRLRHRPSSSLGIMSRYEADWTASSSSRTENATASWRPNRQGSPKVWSVNQIFSATVKALPDGGAQDEVVVVRVECDGPDRPNQPVDLREVEHQYALT